MIFFVCEILRKFDMHILQICPFHLSDAATLATLPCEIQKSRFQQYFNNYMKSVCE